MFKIFYSWQSDLPQNKTKLFIRECIDEAITLALDSEAIEAVRDEATLGTTGSPDIVDTLFSKIDECDLFIADVTLCFTEDEEKVKRSPNPNVMLELGYAVKTLGWNRIICLCNTDFGEKFPFDFDHNRRTSYSFKASSRMREKNRISKIIFENISVLRNELPRARAGEATHILGSYDFKQKKVTTILDPLKIEEQEGFILHNLELIETSKKLVEKIKTMIVKDEMDHSINVFKADIVQKTVVSLKEAEVSRDYDKEEIKNSIQKWLNCDVDDSFFYCGDLKKREQYFGSGEELVGTTEQKEKYSGLLELSYYLMQLEVRSLFVKTFEGMDYIPLAIQNISSTDDQNIRIVVHVKEGEIIEPKSDLICEELKNNLGLVCREDDENAGVGVIDELFAFREDGNILLEELPYDFSKAKLTIPIPTIYGLRTPEKDKNDYEKEIQEYLACSSGSYYEFEVCRLRPNECRWLSRGILIRPIENRIHLEYQIYSSHSSGDLKGELILLCND